MSSHCSSNISVLRRVIDVSVHNSTISFANINASDNNHSDFTSTSEWAAILYRRYIRHFSWNYAELLLLPTRSLNARVKKTEQLNPLLKTHVWTALGCSVSSGTFRWTGDYKTTLRLIQTQTDRVSDVCLIAVRVYLSCRGLGCAVVRARTDSAHERVMRFCCRRSFEPQLRSQCIHSTIHINEHHITL